MVLIQSHPTTQIPVPVGTWEWLLSWSVPEQTMRIRLMDWSKDFKDWPIWKFRQGAGNPYVLGCDSLTGRIRLCCGLKIENDVARFLPPKNVILPDVASWTPAKEFPGRYVDGNLSHYRFCFFRNERVWRALDERTGVLTLVASYEGVMNLRHLDSGSHVHHDGPMTLDTKGILHLRHVSP